MAKRPAPWPPREDRRVRRERTVTNANRTSTYGLTDDIQAKLREMVLQIITAEPEHPDAEVRFRHIGAAISHDIVVAGCMSRTPQPWAVAIIDGVLATELRRYAQRVYKDEYDQAREPKPRPGQTSFL